MRGVYLIFGVRRSALEVSGVGPEQTNHPRVDIVKSNDGQIQFEFGCLRSAAARGPKGSRGETNAIAIRPRNSSSRFAFLLFRRIER